MANFIPQDFEQLAAARADLDSLGRILEAAGYGGEAAAKEALPDTRVALLLARLFDEVASLRSEVKRLSR